VDPHHVPRYDPGTTHLVPPCNSFSESSALQLILRIILSDEYNEEEEEERLERNEQLVEAYSELAGEIRSNQAGGKGGRLLVEVALDAPERWLAEVVAPRCAFMHGPGLHLFISPPPPSARACT
jgi:hypothetical protein